MSDLIILAERDISRLLKINKIYPSLLCTSTDKMRPRLPYIKDSHIVIMFNGLCEFNIPTVVELYLGMVEQSKGSNEGIKSVSIITDIGLRDFKEYYKYTGLDIRNTQRIENEKVIKKNVDLWNNLNYEVSEKCLILSQKEEQVTRAYSFLKDIEPSVEYLRMEEIINQ